MRKLLSIALVALLASQGSAGCGNVATGGQNSSNTQDLQAACANGSTRTIYLLNGSGNCDASFAKGTVTAAALTLPSTNILNLKIVMATDTEADFYANNIKVCEITSNIPNTTSLPVGMEVSIFSEASISAAARQIYTDFTSISGTLSSARSP